MRILIYGLPKTGTTALFYRIADSLKKSKKFFEVRDTGGGSVVCKRLFPPFDLDGGQPDLSSFKKKIWVVRDPRDRIISWMLYDSGFHRAYSERFHQSLLQKEEDPTSISVKKLLEIGGFPPVRGWVVEPKALDWHKANGHLLFTWNYEAGFTTPELDGVSGYLGRPVQPAGKPVDGHERVRRKGEPGDWKNWFLEEDVDLFWPHCEPYMIHFGYKLDWSLPDSREILPSHSSSYYLSLTNIRTGGV